MKRWVLKSPDHVFGLEKLFSIFPDARIVQTHRNPLEVLRSLNQLNEVLRGLFVRPSAQDQGELREARELAAGMERFIRFRDGHPELAGRFIDVNYSELVSAPLGDRPPSLPATGDSANGGGHRADASPGCEAVAAPKAPRGFQSGRFDDSMSRPKPVDSSAIAPGSAFPAIRSG